MNIIIDNHIRTSPYERLVHIRIQHIQYILYSPKQFQIQCFVGSASYIKINESEIMLE